MQFKMTLFWYTLIPVLMVQTLMKWIWIIIILVLILGCKEEELPPEDNNPGQGIDGSWIMYSPIKWSHDGKPFQTDYCMVFSDGASYEMKQLAGELADKKYLEILDMFSFTEVNDLKYPTERQKIDVYLNTSHTENIAAAYWGSIFITVRTQALDTARYAYLFKHELTHTFEFLVEGTVNLAGHMWFTEGIAVYCGGLNRDHSLEELEKWITMNDQSPNNGNPITIRKWEDYPVDADKPGYTVVFDLVMKYMLDPRGMDRSLADVLNVYYDLRSHMPFDESFERNFRISVDTLEEGIFDRLREYLDTRL